jgi:hypothetical protein
MTSDVGFSGEELGEPCAICATSAAVEFNGHSYLATAGHIVKGIENDAGNPQKRITSATLFNAWAHPSHLTQDPLPIDLYELKTYAKYDRGEGAA